MNARSARSNPSPGLTAALMLMASILGGCSARKGGPSPRPNVLLVTIDTLRADHVGCYGYRAAATPTLDGLAARGVRFATAVAHVPLTGPSHTSILTSRTPLGHGVRDNGGYVLPADGAQRGRGLPAGRVPHGRLRLRLSRSKRRFGLDHGFETYDDQLPRGKDARRTAYVERTADRTTDAALRWLDAPRRGRRPRPRSSSGSTTSTPTLPTRRRRSSARGRPRPTTARSPSWTPSSAACCAASTRPGRDAARARHRGPRREPGRARRGHPRHLRLRLDAAGALHPGRARRARRAAWPRPSRGGSTSRRRSSTTRASRRRGMEGRSLRRAASGERLAGRAVLRGVRSTRSSSTAGPRSTPGGRRATS